MTFASLKIDAALIASLSALLELIGSNFLGLAPDHFTADFGIVIWPGCCALVTFAYVQLQDRVSRLTTLRVGALFLRFIFLFLAFAAAAVAFDYWRHPWDRGEWQLGALFLVVPAAVTIVTGFAVGCVVRVSRSHVI